MWTKVFAQTLIPSFVAMVLVSILIGYLLRNKEEKIKFIPIQIIAVLIVGLEIMKQIYGIIVGYINYWLPFHFCSLFIFIIPIMAFYKGKHKDLVRIVVTTMCAMLFMFMCVGPTIVYTENDILDFGKDLLSFHTVLFHNLVLLVFALMFSLRLFKFEAKRDVLSIIVFLSIFCVISATMANVLKTNYNSFYDCQVAILENVRVILNNSMGSFGQFVYVFMICVGTLCVGVLSYGLVCLVDFIIKKITTKTVEKNKVS